jgi:hypothetical protein
MVLTAVTLAAEAWIIHVPTLMGNLSMKPSVCAAHGGQSVVQLIRLYGRVWPGN